MRKPRRARASSRLPNAQTVAERASVWLARASTRGETPHIGIDLDTPVCAPYFQSINRMKKPLIFCIAALAVALPVAVQ